MSTVPVSAGCDWPVDPGCLTDWDGYDADVQARAVSFASATLRRLTGYRVGGCPVTVRPCKPSCRDLAYPSYYDMLASGSGVSFWPHIGTDGLWVNSCGCRTSCSCTALCEIVLPPPVGRVDQVLLDGLELDAGRDYRVDGNRLVWIDTRHECGWPVCQDLTLSSDEPGTFAVTYLNSYPVDTLGAYAAGILANEFAKACTGGKCRLPATVTSVTRQGVSFDITPGTFPGGYTGIREVDAYIGLWNPDGARETTRVWSPDIRQPRVVR